MSGQFNHQRCWRVTQIPDSRPGRSRARREGGHPQWEAASEWQPRGRAAGCLCAGGSSGRQFPKHPGHPDEWKEQLCNPSLLVFNRVQETQRHTPWSRMNCYHRAPRSATGRLVREDGWFTAGYTHAEHKERRAPHIRAGVYNAGVSMSKLL